MNYLFDLKIEYRNFMDESLCGLLGVPNLWLAGQIQPTIPFNPTREGYRQLLSEWPFKPFTKLMFFVRKEFQIVFRSSCNPKLLWSYKHFWTSSNIFLKIYCNIL